ncbi:MAG TPA: DUF4215 domain-containing protein [Kofleriaceae bacterium]
MRITHYLLGSVTALCLASCSFGGSTDQSALSGQDGGSDDCTLTQGYWKNHADAWPVSSLTLGTVTYTKVELIAILKTPVKGNGLIQLAHQLIAAKLNVAAGASDADVKVAIQQADALIGSLVSPPKGDGVLATSATSALTGKLDAYNSGDVGPGHCGEDNGDDDDDDCEGDSCQPPAVCGNGVMEGAEECDDGNLVDHDGCSSTCTVDECDQPDAVCGNGVMEGAEACDDGNTTNGDGCSSTCTVEEPVCVCGDGVVSGSETCDDGNTTSGDGCSSTCTIELPVCGNGVIETGETCDDGNTTSGDGCSSVCICEPCIH